MKQAPVTTVSIEDLLATLDAPALRFLCRHFKLAASGSKEVMRERLFESPYADNALFRTARDLVFGFTANHLVVNEHWRSLLEVGGGSTSGSSVDLVFRVAELDLMDAEATMREIGWDDLRNWYHAMFDVVPTHGREKAELDLLVLFGYKRAAKRLARKAVVTNPDAGKTTANYDYDVALSFAGEDRSKVENVYAELRSRGVAVFYDRNEKARLWGKDLAQEFPATYGPRSRFVIAFVSKYYPTKVWTDFEFGNAKVEAGRRKEEFILPVRLDDTLIVGLPRTVAYLDYDAEGAKGLADIVEKKLGRNGHPNL